MRDRLPTFDDADLNHVVATTFARDVRHHKVLASTSDAALELSRDAPAALPLLVLTDRQTAGRGRGTNTWWSDVGSLTFSVLLDMAAVHLSAAMRPRISLATGLAVCDAVDETLGRRAVQLKWPNDVMSDGRKLCGILAEVSPHRQDLLVLGIGVNVNNASEDAPAELRAVATSLRELAERSFSARDVLISILKHMEQRLSWVGEHEGQLQRDWQRRCMLTGQHVQIELPDGSLSGTCKGIDPEGALLLETPQGRRRCLSGVVRRWT